MSRVRVFCWLVVAGLLLLALTAAQTPQPPVFSQIAFTGWASCGLTPAGEIYCWGSEPERRPPGVRPRMQRIAVHDRYAALAAGKGFICALTVAGAAYCWDLGHRFWMVVTAAHGPTYCSDCDSFRLKRILASLDHPVHTVYVGSGVSEALFPDFQSPRPADRVQGVPMLTQLSAGGLGVCGLDSAGTAYCWDEDHPARAIASPVPFASIALGDDFACGLSPAGALYCWGDGNGGVLGMPRPGLQWCRANFMGVAYWNYPCSRAPVPVAVELTFRSVAAGGAHICGLTADGTAYCWGWDAYGQLGLGRQAGTLPWDSVLRYHASASPAPVATPLRFASLAATAFPPLASTCGLTADGDVYCWGTLPSAQGEDLCQLAIPGAPADTEKRPCNLAPRLVGHGDFRQIALETYHACALDAEGRAYCWGKNTFGQLGDGTFQDRVSPVRVVVLPAPDR